MGIRLLDPESRLPYQISFLCFLADLFVATIQHFTSHMLSVCWILDYYFTYRYCKVQKEGNIGLESGGNRELSLHTSGSKQEYIVMSDGLFRVSNRDKLWTSCWCDMINVVLNLINFTCRQCHGGELVLQYPCSLLDQKMMLAWESFWIWSCLLTGP